MLQKPPFTGQRYRETRLTAFGKPSRTIWVLNAVSKCSDGRMYANLVREDDSSMIKAISLGALQDEKLYRPVAD